LCWFGGGSGFGGLCWFGDVNRLSVLHNVPANRWVE